MNIVDITRKYLKDNGLDYLLINSCNEYLEEYTPLEENARYKLTGFAGSTGDALISKDKLYLFVDGRYHEQADMEVDRSIVTVVKLQMGETFLTAFSDIIKPDDTLGVMSKKVSQQRLLALKNFCNVKLLGFQEIAKWSECKIEDEIKTPRQIAKTLKTGEAILVSNLEEISYLLNVRDFSVPYSSKIHAGKCLVTKDFIKYFKGDVDTNGIKKVWADKTLTNAYDFAKYNCVPLKSNPITEMKAVKTAKEISAYKKSFALADKALLMTRDYIEKTDFISEFDIAKNLEENFYKTGALGLSFASIVAKDKNSALAHYSKNSKQETLKDGSLILIDCGAYYSAGLATDATRVFVKGTPTKLQKEIYTKVLKGFLKAFTYKVKPTTSGYLIDKAARKLLNEIKPQGFNFGHGLGHGIGISVHEAPPNLSPSEVAKHKLVPNMCFTIEPGLYNPEHFGVRLENSCYLDKNYVIQSFSKMPFEKKLINFDMLTPTEKRKLKQFKVI